MVFDQSAKTIRTDRLLLRLFQEKDAGEVARLCNNYNLYKSTLHLPYPYTAGDARSWIAHHLDHFVSDKSYEFAVTDKANGTLYGAIALTNNRKFRHGELGYWIGEDYWGNGFATEAAEAIVRFAFNEKSYHKVFARSFHSNPASEKVLQKIGMRKEGLLIDHVRKNSKYEDLALYGIINAQHIGLSM